MTLECLEKLALNVGLADITHRLENMLIDGIIFAFHDQNSEGDRIVRGFGAIIQALGLRAGPHFQQICGIIHFRLKNRQITMRQQAADLIRWIAPTMKLCGDQVKLGKMGSMLY
jgi:splicing factor 3B subunit 1